MVTKEDIIFLRQAIDLARRGMESGLGGPFGCIVVRNGEVVGEGSNGVTSTNDPTAHAEIMAIRDACRRLGDYQLTDCTVYTSCEPCPMCLSACYWARLDAVYYGACAADAARAGFDDAFLYDEFRKSPAERQLPSTQLLGDEAWSSFQTWLDTPNKIEY